MNTINEIQQEILDRKNGFENLDALSVLTTDEQSANPELNSTSKVAIWRLMIYIISFGIWDIRQKMDTHKKEIEKIILNQKHGRLSWYRDMALRFQYGFDLLTDSDQFDNSNATAEQISDSKIIKYSAVNEGDSNGVIVVKIAGETNGVLAPISIDPANNQKAAVEAYFEEIKYAGSDITIINYLPDRLYLNLKIYRDPLVIDANGFSIINGGKPVETAILEYMKELPFNGELVLAHLIDKLQTIDGVKIPHLIVALSSWIDPVVNGYGTPTPISVKRVPESGYFEIPNFYFITYVV